ncbi:MAG: aminopeptidase [Oscillospiraceae bacterium]|nr:aminopeptidase [Oscillospiraceae bacterium]
MENKQKEYANLLIEIGLSLQPGQTLLIQSPVECAHFARLCASAAYDAGCREVVLSWSDDRLTRERYLRAADGVFDEVPEWRRRFFNDYAAARVPRLVIDATDPETLRGVDTGRIVRAQRAAGEALEPYYHAYMNNDAPWCIAAVPIPSWAKKVFPDKSEDEAMAALWNAIFETVRITGDGQSAARWRAHLATLKARKDKLNALRFKSLHYTNSLGTDLTIELPEGHLWAAGNGATPKGQPFVANMPTEEIFTAPHRMGINGVVYAALPLVDNGNIIDGFHFVIREGKIVASHAERGGEFLEAAYTVDEGASRFGEVALVPYDSPISNQGILYYNTLFDENARCHLAFGEAYPECLEGGNAMSREELKAHGLNWSINHVDFMVGTADLSIVGTTHDGREIPVFIDGNFAL